ncbi:ESAG11-related protein, putative [Anopheles sinensis]|uniref:ESAG11-related protein, putative n=1 Tax=Anopheles sinensis TaxID=74873 RepID=A0A084VIN4_ANOSI|nr:ESAG11-related protein, putative [Anopheles sinensis]
MSDVEGPVAEAEDGKFNHVDNDHGRSPSNGSADFEAVERLEEAIGAAPNRLHDRLVTSWTRLDAGLWTFGVPKNLF